MTKAFDQAAIGWMPLQRTLITSATNEIIVTPPDDWKALRLVGCVIGTALNLAPTLRGSLDGVNYLSGATDYTRQMWYLLNATAATQDNIGLPSAYLAHQTNSAGVPVNFDAVLYQAPTASHRATMYSRGTSDVYISHFKTWMPVGLMKKFSVSMSAGATTFAAGSWVHVEVLQ